MLSRIADDSFLMVSLIGINFALSPLRLLYRRSYPISSQLAGIWKISQSHAHLFYEVSWWSHILMIFIFANYLPYSKHFHVFMSVPNLFFSNLEPLAKLPNLMPTRR